MGAQGGAHTGDPRPPRGRLARALSFWRPGLMPPGPPVNPPVTARVQTALVKTRPASRRSPKPEKALRSVQPANKAFLERKQTRPGLMPPGPPGNHTHPPSNTHAGCKPRWSKQTPQPRGVAETKKPFKARSLQTRHFLVAYEIQNSEGTSDRMNGEQREKAHLKARKWRWCIGALDGSTPSGVNGKIHRINRNAHEL